jgi:type II secretory pathway pseudopilin PulG
MKSRATAGYTIAEVMIVLAVTGALFVSTALMLGGRSAQSEATQSVRGYEAQLQTIASDVANGYYPNGFKCQPPVLDSGTVTVSATAVNPGGNAGCVFLGKIINLSTDKAGIITVVGRQYVTGKTDAKTIAEAKPIVVATGDVNVTQDYAYQYSLRLQKAVSIADGTQYKAIAYMLELGGGSASSSTSSGSRGVLLYGIAGTPGSTADVDIQPLQLVPIPGGVRLCFLTGNDRNAEFSMGESGAQTSTRVLLDSGVGSDCA